MKFLSIALIFSFFTSSTEIIFKMVDALYLPDDLILIEGENSDGKKIVLEFDKKNRRLSQTFNDGKSSLDVAEAPLFLKLFFFDGEKGAPETIAKSVEQISKSLKAVGINPELISLDVNEFNGEVAATIGKERRFAESNFLSLSRNSMRPAILSVDDETILFSHYHKSVLPFAFPGKIDFFKNKRLVETWTFLRKEFKSR